MLDSTSTGKRPGPDRRTKRNKAFEDCHCTRQETVRVIRYRQHKPSGDALEAYWLANFPSRQISRRCLYSMAKSRWHVENEGFSDAKNRYGLEHIRHHHERSLLIVWLLTCLALTLERVYRLRYLHRGLHPVRTAINLLRLLVLGLSVPVVTDSS